MTGVEMTCTGCSIKDLYRPPATSPCHRKLRRNAGEALHMGELSASDEVSHIGQSGLAYRPSDLVQQVHTLAVIKSPERMCALECVHTQIGLRSSGSCRTPTISTVEHSLK